MSHVKRSSEITKSAAVHSACTIESSSAAASNKACSSVIELRNQQQPNVLEHEGWLRS